MKPLATALAALLYFGTSSAFALDVGDKVPAFSAFDDSGKTWSFPQNQNKKILVVYFYPADLTRGCTAQACGFRDDMEALKGKGVEVVGVSGDTVKNHQLFKKVHHLNFTLLADDHGDVAKAFGVPVKKGGGPVRPKVDGKQVVLEPRGVATPRWTFVIDKEGQVVLKNTKVNAAEDSKAVLSAIDSMKKS
jgi:thioredoxin-dependent peroxiredoxin